ncbi:MAG TPA: ATP-grasp domain-containing protein [Thermodesulfobacteriota bacterium]|nr:ATP-grasp domain-containing protein [Thermodesulfobacteriota bacterium]
MNNNKPGAVITGGDFQGLGALRSLAQKDIPIILLDGDHCIGRYSRFKKKFIKSPSLSKTETYFDFLIGLAKKEKIHGWVIFPNSDEAVYVLAKYKEALKDYYRIPTPDWEVTQYVYNKENTYRAAEKYGIPIPKTFYPKSLSELLELNLWYPLVIKPAIRDHFYNKTKIKAFRVNNQKELTKIYQWVCSIIDPSEVLVQDFIPGGPKNLYSFCPLFKDGKVVASITARRARQHPMDFGHASTYVELVHIPEMQTIAEKFLRLINYYGIAEVEFMMDPRDGKYKLLEVNPRVWGWHTLAIYAGVNFPYLLYQDMTGQPLEVPPPSDGLKWVRLSTDIPTVFWEIVKGNMKIRDYVASMKGKKKEAVFSLHDPLPFIAEIMMIPYLWMKRGF